MLHRETGKDRKGLPLSQLLAMIVQLDIAGIDAAQNIFYLILWYTRTMSRRRHVVGGRIHAGSSIGSNSCSCSIWRCVGFTYHHVRLWQRRRQVLCLMMIMLRQLTVEERERERD